MALFSKLLAREHWLGVYRANIKNKYDGFYSIFLAPLKRGLEQSCLLRKPQVMIDGFQIILNPKKKSSRP